MATTSPDNLYSPNSGNQYALVQDLGEMQSSVQRALVTRANMYLGTTAQRQAFTNPPAGTHWQDTNGDQLEYVFRNGSWVAIPRISIAQGEETLTAPSGGGQATRTISFPPGRFSAVPNVQLTAQTGAGPTVVMTLNASSRTTSSFVMTLNRSNNTPTTIMWTATQTLPA